MLLALDVGNTHVVVGLMGGRQVRRSFRIATRRDNAVGDYAVALSQLLELAEVDRRDVEQVIISSVVPPVTRALQGARYRRHHRGDDDLLHVPPIHLRQLQKLAQCHGVIAHGVVAPGGNAEAAAHLPPPHQSYDHVGVAHVQCKQHTNSLPFYALVLRAASLPRLYMTALAMAAPVIRLTAPSTSPLTPTKAMTNRKALELPRAATKP